MTQGCENSVLQGTNPFEKGLSDFLTKQKLAAQLHLIEGYVAKAYCIRPLELYNSKRGKSYIAEARQLVMYLAHVELGMPLADVARHYGRDRSTAAYACREVEHRREDAPFDELVGQIEQMMSMSKDLEMASFSIFRRLQ